MIQYFKYAVMLNMLCNKKRWQTIKSFTLSLLYVGLIYTVSTNAFADIYRYVDKHGRVTFTDKPKHEGFKLLIKTWKGWVDPETVSKKKTNKHNWKANQKKYDNEIRLLAQHYRLPRELLHAVITAESAYDPHAVSRAGAVGLMQLMPATAERYGVKDRYNPTENMRGGVNYLHDLLKMFGNDYRLAVAAYNAGENAVKRYGRKIPPFKETQTYVKRVIKYYRQYKDNMI